MPYQWPAFAGMQPLVTAPRVQPVWFDVRVTVPHTTGRIFGTALAQPCQGGTGCGERVLLGERVGVGSVTALGR
jgi:hypothetical protein